MRTKRLANVLPAAMLALAAAAPAQTALPRVPTAQLRAGQFAFVPDPYSDPERPSEILLVRDRTGTLRAWFVPVRGGSHRLPADERWSPGPPCPEFVVDFDAGAIGCRSPAMPAEWTARYRWRIDGRRLTDFVPDLIAVPGTERSGHFVLHG